MSRRRWLVPLGVALLPLPVLPVLLAVQPAGGVGDVLLGLALVSGIAAAATAGVMTLSSRGTDGFTVTPDGIEVRHHRRGTHVLRWGELRELGWVTPTEYTSGGLAGRRREGGAYDLAGPNIVGWLAQPPGWGRPLAVDQLAAVCQEHGVAWREYAAAEVM